MHKMHLSVNMSLLVVSKVAVKKAKMNFFKFYKAVKKNKFVKMHHK